MNKFYVVLIIICLGLFSILIPSCVIAPWHVVWYDTLPEDFDFTQESWEILFQNEKKNLLKDVYFYISTVGTNQTDSSIEDPYYFVFRFKSYASDKKISIKKIAFYDKFFQKKEFLKTEILLELKKKVTIDTETGETHTSKNSICVYSSEHLFNLKAYEKKEILVTVSFSVTDENGTLTKTGDYVLKRHVKWGVFQCLN